MINYSDSHNQNLNDILKLINNPSNSQDLEVVEIFNIQDISIVPDDCEILQPLEANNIVIIEITKNN